MRWGRVLVLVLTGLVGLGIGLVVAEPWDGPTSVDALELDEAWREEDADAGMPDVDDDDDDGTGNRARNDLGATDDGRDGTREGDTQGNRGTGTGDSAVGSAGIVNAATDDGGAANGGATDDGATAASASGGGDT